MQSIKLQACVFFFQSDQTHTNLHMYVYTLEYQQKHMQIY